jgi:2-keto-4-pentenoate hydratase
MEAAALHRAAGLLGAARTAANPVPGLAENQPSTIADGYAVQAALHRYFLANSDAVLAGWKIGATTPAMQTYLGVDGPAYGRILSTNVHPPAARLPRTGFCQPGMECEIAVRVGRNATDIPYTRDTVGDIVDDVMPAIEIVENRYGDFLSRGTPTMIADDFFHKACVLGAGNTDWRTIDLAAVAGRTLVDGAEKGSGRGSDVMGHPLEAVAWLANMLAERGEVLAAGQIVLTGSVAPVIWIDEFPCRTDIELDGLGSVSVELV